MPPRSRYAPDLTQEELEELAGLGTAPLPPLASARAPRPAPFSVSIGDAVLDPDELDAIDPSKISISPGEDDAWLDELIGRPEAAPARPMLGAAGPGATFSGEDTPQARELIKQRGMRPTTPPSDDELLDPSAFERPAAPLDLGDDEGWLDDMIAQEGAAMDREQAPSAPFSAPAPRRSREEQVAELFAAPTRGQGFAAILGDALFGGNNVASLNARAQHRQNALAQARMQDVAAGERHEERAADREMTDARMALTARGQDLAYERATENQDLRRQLADQQDRRMRELETQREGAAAERNRERIASFDRARGPTGAPAPVGVLAQQANVSREEAQRYLAGKMEGLAPDKLERLQNFDETWQGMSEQKQQEARKGVFAREGATPDQVAAGIESKQWDPRQRMDVRNELIVQSTALTDAVNGWKSLSPKARDLLVKFGGSGESTLVEALKNAGLSPAEQVAAARVQRVVNIDIKSFAGATVTGSEWTRQAKGIGLPVGDFDPWKSPDVMTDYLRKSRQVYQAIKSSAELSYPKLFEGMQ